MIVFIEGADGSGKSTLFKQFKDLGYKTDRVQSNPNEILEWIRIASDTKSTIIFDRCSFISDMVYRLADNKNRLGMNLREISVVMNWSDVIIIYCKTDSSFTDAMERGEDLITNKRHHDKICEIYDIVMDMFKIFSDVPVMEYNWKEQTIHDVISFIERSKHEPTSI